MSNLDFPAGSYEEFIEILKTKPALAPLIDGQVMQGLNVFQNLALEYALQRTERARQDVYLNTALNRSSILALSEDRQYVPRKATPSTGKVAITNKNNVEMGIPANYVLVSENQIYYMTGDAIDIPPGETVENDLSQIKSESITFTVEQEAPFLEFLLDRSLSKNVSVLKVFVDLGQGFVEWKQSVRFRNTDDRSMVFDEFYSHSDQLGVRFGNGSNGMIPLRGSKVRVDALVTDGATELMPNQTLTAVGLHVKGAEFVTANTVIGGKDQEGLEEIRRNALYYTLYDEEIVWNSDYRFYILRWHPNINWLNVWGEQEMEEIEGGFDQSFINKIYFTAHAPGEEDINDRILESLSKLPPLNRKYKPIEREDHTFVIEISGILDRSVLMEEARMQIEAKLNIYYGKGSFGPNGTGRREQVHIRELYSLMDSLGIFAEGEDVIINVSGKGRADNLKQMLFIDIHETMNSLDLAY